MRACIIGTGACLPPNVVTNAEVMAALQLPTDSEDWARRKAPWVEARLGIKSRRYFYKIDAETGTAIVDRSAEPGELTLSFGAATAALKMAEVDPRQLDGLIVVGCTPAEPHFSHGATRLQHKLGMRGDARVFYLDLGCGGFIAALDLAQTMLKDTERYRKVLVVGVNIASAFFNRTAYRALHHEKDKNGSWLSLALFGDGAGALVLEGRTNPYTGILGCWYRSLQHELVVHPGGGSHCPASAAERWASTYCVSELVREVYLQFMPEALSGLRTCSAYTSSDVKLWFLHSANRLLVEELIGLQGLNPDLVPHNVGVVGNLSAATIPNLLDARVRAGELTFGSGELVVFGAIGAPSIGGAMLVRL